MGSNPTLSVKNPIWSMIPAVLSVSQAIPPDDCVITGFCAGRPDQVGPGSGLIFLALGLIALGAWSWWTARRRPADGSRPAAGRQR